MTKQEAFKEINDTQDYYVNELLNKINSTAEDYMMVINFQSPTGTGKTKMMAKLMNLMPDVFFIVTTLSKGQLDRQIETTLKADCKYNNFAVYGCQKYTVNSKLQANDILSLIPANKQFIWLRDEGHINTNRWEDLLKDKAFKMINITATPDNADIKCNFTNTMMLRTVHQSNGTPADAIEKLLEVKKQHSKIKSYNPCAIFRCIADELVDNVIDLCKQNNLKYINITEEDFDMSDLCKDDNEYDVIINKFKIVEGIDIRRTHVLYLDNQPSSNKTTIQVIGRCRRNALLYNDKVDIFAPSNEKLLENTRQCFVYYNVENMKIDEDENGELASAFCDTISVEQLKADSVITAKNGILPNGLKIIELGEESGTFRVLKDTATGFNVIKPEGDFYQEQTIFKVSTLYGYTKKELAKLPKEHRLCFNYATGKYEEDLDGPFMVKLFIKNDTGRKVKILGITKLPKYNYELEIIGNKVIKHNYKARAPKSLYYSTEGIRSWEFYNETKSTHNFKSEEAKLKFLASLPKQIPLVFTAYESYTGNQIHSWEFFNAEKDAKKVVISANNPFVIIKLKHGTTITITEKEYNAFMQGGYYEYTKVFNDRESAIIGTDIMKQVKDSYGSELWVEDKAVTSKVKRASKLNTFIESTYQKELEAVKDELFTGRNNFKFDTKCNKCLGYCVEYYSKYLVYGERYLGSWLREARKEAKIKDETFINDNLVIRACMLKYRELMIEAYGSALAKLIPTIGAQQLIRESYAEFVKTVIELGTKTADFVKQELNITKQLQDDDKLYDPNLSIKHIAGLADYINKDTIIDIKTTNNISKSYIKQVLAYHYLSTKRSDLDIRTVIVYDAVSGRSVKIKL